MIQVATAPWGFTIIQWDSAECDGGCFLSDHDTLHEAWGAARDFAANHLLPLEDYGNVTALTYRGAA